MGLRFIMLRSTLSAISLSLFIAVNATAQLPPGVRPEISGSVVRVFGGMGYTFALDVRTPVAANVLNADHSVGLQAWYGLTDIVTRPGGNTESGLPVAAISSDRVILGAGANWRTGFRFVDGRIRPYVSFPVQYVRSSIENVRWMVRPPVEEQPLVVPPSYNRPGTESGFAYGVGIGTELWPYRAIGIGFSGTVMRHNLYDDQGPPWVFFSFGLLYATDAF